MAIILVQTDFFDTPCGAMLACTSPADGLAWQARTSQAEVGGTPGVNEFTVTINRADIQAGVMFESPAVGKTIWEAGTYTVRLNVTTAVANLLLTEVHVCRVNSSCVSQATVGSTTGLTISMGSLGVKSVEVTGAEQSAADTDKIYIVLIFANSAHADAIFGFTPDQNIDTPIFTYKVEGVSKDKDGNALGSCLCFLCRDNQDNSCSYIAYVLSDSVTGAYSFTGLLNNDAQHFVISWKDNTPHVFDVTDHVLQPLVE